MRLGSNTIFLLLATTLFQVVLAKLPQTNDETCFKVSEIICYDLPTIGRRKYSFYVVVTIDDQLRWTSANKQSRGIRWSDELYFDANMLDDGQMTVQVCAKRSLGEDVIVGGFNVPVDVFALLKDDNNAVIRESLFKIDKNGQMGQVEGSIQIALRRTSSSAIHLDLLEDGAGNAVSAMHGPRHATTIAGVILWGASTGMKMIQCTYDVWKPLLLKIEAFVKLMDGISEIHPYARMAWSVLSLPLKAIISQNKRDKKIQGLLESMNDIYLVVLKARPLTRIDTHRKTLQLMCQQTAECAFFISDYASRGFGARMAKSATTDYVSKIDEYQRTFRRLKDDFLYETAVVIEITVFQIATKVDQILSETIDLSTVTRFDNMHYANKPFNPERCLVGTRKNVISNIIKWLSRPDSEAARVYWLSGVAGCGKSAIARSVGDQLLAQRRGVSFFFHASRQADCGPDRLFATISRSLTEISDSWRSCLFELLKRSPSARDCCTVEEQFESFLLGPAKMVDNIGPVMIVIDALDESGTVEQRARLLKVLKRLPELPPHFRFLITSRPEVDICHALEGDSWVFHKELSSVNPAETDIDIGLFVKDYLQDTPHLQKSNINEWTQAIVMRSDHLFQWAATACKHIRGNKGDMIGDNPNERVATILELGIYDGLDSLYKAILDRLTKFERGDVIYKRFQTIMGRILLLREPLSMNGLVGLLCEEEDESHVKMILAPLGSLLSGVSQRDVPIQPLHLSFTDFLKAETRSGKYWINMQGQNARLTKSLFRVMQSSLRFNICELPTSYQSNDKVEDLRERISGNISAHLNYACRYWMDHLKYLISRDWLDFVGILMRSHLLFWFEVLSLIGKFGLALSQLTNLREWLFHLKDTNEMRLFVEDALRFGTAFAHVIRHSTPHLYLSALPFIPRSSPVSQAYLPNYPGCLNVVDINKLTWPRTFLSIHVETIVNAVIFSPDGKSVISDSPDGVQIWSADTGELIAGPFRGHTDIVVSIGCSPDGTRIISGSSDKTIRLWSVSGESVAEPFRGHSGAVVSVGFSPDGKQIVSGSTDKTVIIWDAGTGKIIVGPFQGHTNTVLSVGFSPDGNRVISSSADKTIRIWGATAGELIAGPFQSHTDWVRTSLFLRDGERIISCSDDETIRVWNIDSNRNIPSLFQGHTGCVMSIALSSDGRYIVSGSQDRTVIVWDIASGELAVEPFHGHTAVVQSVGFSPDGKKVVSGSEDGIIRIWSINIGVSGTKALPEDKSLTISKAVGERVITSQAAIIMPSPSILQSRINPVTSVGFSPEGQRIVTGSSNGTVLIWNAGTGELVAGPFPRQNSRIIHIGFSPDGKRIISGSADGEIVVWNIDTGDIVNSGSSRYSFHLDLSTSSAFSPDLQRFVSGSYTGTIEIWDIDTRNLVAESPKSHDPRNTDMHVIQTVAFSPDGQKIISGSADGTVKFWDAGTGKLTAKPFKGHRYAVSVIRFSPDGKQVASGSWDKTIRVWSAKTGAPVAGPLHGHRDTIRSLVFSPDGKKILSGSYDRTVRVWDAGTGELVARPFQGHTNPVKLVEFSPDGNRAISGSEDGTVRMWSILRSSNSTSVSSPSNSDYDSQFFAKSSSARGFRRSNGWLLSNEYPGKLLFWIPEQFYPDILSPERVFLIASNPLRLDVDNFSHGDGWAQCYKP